MVNIAPQKLLNEQAAKIMNKKPLQRVKWVMGICDRCGEPKFIRLWLNDPVVRMCKECIQIAEKEINEET